MARQHATGNAVVQLLASAVLLVVVYIVATPTHMPRSALMSYPTHVPRGTRIRLHNEFSTGADMEMKDEARQDNGEVDLAVSNAPMQEQVSNMDVTVEVTRPHLNSQKAAHKAAGGLTGHHVVVDGVDASWARTARTSALAQAPGKMQKLTADYLEAQGINTGEEFNHVFDHRVHMGSSNPSVFFAAGREVPDLQPNPPATAFPKRPLNKLSKMGIYTGTEHTQWDDSMVASKGMEEPYNFGASPTRELGGPSRRAGGWGIFKPQPGSLAMLADADKKDLTEVLEEKEEVEGGKKDVEGTGGVKVDSFPESDEKVPEHMRINADPRKAWVKPPPSNGNLKHAGVYTGEEHHDFGDVHVNNGELSPVHVSISHHLREVGGVNTGDEGLLHVDKGNHIYVPDTVATAKPRTTNQHKLDKLGVNTGDEHTQWGDSMVQHAEHLEPSYNIGISPNREYNTATPYPGTTNWPAKGTRNTKMGQKLHASHTANASPHDFFKKSVKPLMSHDSTKKVQNAFSAAKTTKKANSNTMMPKTKGAKIKVQHMEHMEHMDLATREAQPYIVEADAAKARAAEAEAALARDVVRARKAEQLAETARLSALEVGSAAAKAQAAKDSFKQAKKAFSAKLAKANGEMPIAHIASKVGRQMTKSETAQAVLDYNAKKDEEENKSFSKSRDVSAVLDSINSGAEDGQDTVSQYQQKHFPAIEPDQAGPMSEIAGMLSAKKKKSVKQVLHARPQRSMAAAMKNHQAKQHHEGITFSRKGLCAISVWGVHPLCPDAYDTHHIPETSV